jgi:hypothetical protein
MFPVLGPLFPIKLEPPFAKAMLNDETFRRQSGHLDSPTGNAYARYTTHPEGE